MYEFFARLFDTTGFAPRTDCEGWTNGLIWLHVGSDLLIWLAYLSIPLILSYFARQRRMPLHTLLGLFATSILACGFGYFFDAVSFRTPMYRLAGLIKLLTAIVSWITVVVLVPAVPRIMANLDERSGQSARRAALPRESRLAGYMVAILAGVVAVLARLLIDPFLGASHAFILPLLAVIFIAWQRGFGPALVTLCLAMLGTVVFVVLPHNREHTLSLSDEIGIGLFFFAGIVTALLGEVQLAAHQRSTQHLAESLGRQAALEEEVHRRRVVEAELRTRTEALAAAERRTAESLAHFRKLADAIPHLVWTAGGDGKLDFVSEQYCKYTGASEEQLKGFGWFESVHPTDREHTAHAWTRALEGESIYDVEYQMLRHDDVYRWFRARAIPIRNDEGVVTRWYGTCTDIEDTKSLQQIIRESERMYRSLAELVPQIVWAANANGVRVFYNAKWYEYTGASEAQSLGDGWLQLAHPDDKEHFATRWRHAVAAGEPFENEYRLRQKDGSYRWFLSRALPQRDESGRIVRWFGTSTDIDATKRQRDQLEHLVHERTGELIRTNATLRAEVVERTRAEHRAETAAVELRRSNDELEKFAYVASHDLQEPLRKIQAFGDRLKTRCREQVDEQGKEFIDRMLNSATRMRRLIEDLLALSRVTTKSQPLIPVDLNQIAADVVSDLETSITQSGGRIELGHLPTIEADPLQMRQLFQNLIGNGLKFRKPDVPPVVKIESSLVDGPTPTCRLSVSDNGIGFDEVYLDRIFQVFQRLHGRNEFEGTGIGLAICRKIAERHGGSITARSRPGEGATFLVTLPLHAAPAAA
jgi:PAS domain S-box-containing protein